MVSQLGEIRRFENELKIQKSSSNASKEKFHEFKILYSLDYIIFKKIPFLEL